MMKTITSYQKKHIMQKKKSGKNQRREEKNEKMGKDKVKKN